MSGIMKVMTTGKFPHLQVVEDGQLVGIVSIGDVVKHRVLEIEPESATLRDVHPHRLGRLSSDSC
jgi:signal-transduction protein with cAMP-binding, CBS, and nucleotidyltransferase domain